MTVVTVVVDHSLGEYVLCWCYYVDVDVVASLPIFRLELFVVSSDEIAVAVFAQILDTPPSRLLDEWHVIALSKVVEPPVVQQQIVESMVESVVR